MLKKALLLLCLLPLGCDSGVGDDSIDGVWHGVSADAYEIVAFDVAAGRFDSYNMDNPGDWHGCYYSIIEGTIQRLGEDRYRLDGDWDVWEATMVASGNTMSFTEHDSGGTFTLVRHDEPEATLRPCD